MDSRKLNILVLFDGAGLAMRGLLDAGHDCTGVELMPEKAHLSKILNPDAKEHIVANVLDLDMDWIESFEAVWASPPCQKRSDVSITKDPNSEDYANYDYYLQWSLNLPNEVLWVENVLSFRYSNNFGEKWNAAQFELEPRQTRRRIIAGRYLRPFAFRQFQYDYPKLNICPAIMASGWKKTNPKFDRSQDWYGRRLSIREAAYHQGVTIPESLLSSWFHPQPGYTNAQWRKNIYEGIGNGVPVYMARAFGDAYSNPQESLILKQVSMFGDEQ